MTEDGKRRLPDSAWLIEAQEICRTCEQFIAATVAAAGPAGAAGVVVGLSGGIDSAVAAALAVRALGPGRVLAAMMPHATSTSAAVDDAREVAGALGIASEEMEITPLVAAWSAMAGEPDRIRRGNVMARVRMILLFDISARDGRLVLGTGNRSEALLGYTTIHGDNACAFNPLGRLYKTEVRLVARHLGLPEAVIAKPPSADLWVGQADEDELGFTYAEVDRLLHFWIDEGLGDRKLVALGFAPDLVARVKARVGAMAFKRQLPPAAEFPGRPDPDLPAPGRGET